MLFQVISDVVDGSHRVETVEPSKLLVVLDHWSIVIIEDLKSFLDD